MDRIVTLVARPNDRTAAVEAAGRVRVALTGGGATTGAVDWLAPIACDIPFASISIDDARIRVDRALRGLDVDALAQPLAGRRKRLLVADMDSTTISIETVDALAEIAGIVDKVRAITERAMDGDLDFRQSLECRVALLADLPARALDAVISTRITLNPGARALVRTMRADGALAVLVSGGFTQFTDHVRDLAGFDDAEGNRLEITGGRLTGRLLEPIINRGGKRQALERLVAARGITIADSLAVGDGANDIDMLRRAGLGVAYRAKPRVAAAAGAHIQYADLRALLYLQGYRADEIVND